MVNDQNLYDSIKSTIEGMGSQVVIGEFAGRDSAAAIIKAMEPTTKSPMIVLFTGLLIKVTFPDKFHPVVVLSFQMLPYR